MAQNVIINGVTYPSVPEVDIPLVGGGTAKFMDTSNATAVAADMLTGKTAYVNGQRIDGSMPIKTAEVFYPSVSGSIVYSGRYLTGNQRFSGVTVTGLTSAVIANGVTVEVGCAEDPDSVTSVTGTLSSAVISQDGTTKILSIS